MLVHSFSSSKYSTPVCSNTFQALDLWKTNKYTLRISDYTSPLLILRLNGCFLEYLSWCALWLHNFYMKVWCDLPVFCTNITCNKHGFSREKHVKSLYFSLLACCFHAKNRASIPCASKSHVNNIDGQGINMLHKC